MTSTPSSPSNLAEHAAIFNQVTGLELGDTLATLHAWLGSALARYDQASETFVNGVRSTASAMGSPFAHNSIIL
jgi:Ser/Thr protein kinase RdoA (MazF antagonist)